jgi:hypothetical protein
LQLVQKFGKEYIFVGKNLNIGFKMKTLIILVIGIIFGIIGLGLYIVVKAGNLFRDNWNK